MFLDTLSLGYLSTVLLEDELKARSSDTGSILSSCFFLSLLLFLLLLLLTYLFFPVLPLSPSFLLPSPLLPFLPFPSPFPSLPRSPPLPPPVSSAPPLPALWIVLFLPKCVWGLRAWGREPRLALCWERQGLARVTWKHVAYEKGNSSLGPAWYQDSVVFWGGKQGSLAEDEKTTSELLHLLFKKTNKQTSEISLHKQDKWLKKISTKKPRLKSTVMMPVEEKKNRAILSCPLLT